MSFASKKLVASLAAGTMLSLAAVSAHAADLDVTPDAEPAPVAKANNFYISIFGGANIPVTDSNFTNGIGIVNVDPNVGFNVGGAIGYKFTNLGGSFTPRLEIEAAYIDNSIGAINFNLNGPGQEVVLSGSDISGVNLLGNAYLDYTGFGKFQPYVVAGVGASFLDLNIAYNVANLNLQDNSTNFLWSIGAGANYQATDTISLFADARFQQHVGVDSLRRVGAVPVGGGVGPGGGIFEDEINNVVVRGGISFSF